MEPVIVHGTGRRPVVFSLGVFVAFWLSATAGLGADSPAIRLVGKEVFLESPGPGVRLLGCGYYVRAAGQEMARRFAEQTKSDKWNVAAIGFSADNGKTWSASRQIVTHRAAEGGTFRRTVYPGWVDSEKEILLHMIVQGVLPGDDPLAGMKHWGLRYALSRDGGRSFFYEAPVIQTGGAYTESHPLKGVWIGRNSVMLGDTTCRPIRLKTGEILQPVQITPIGKDGAYENFGGGLTYHDSAVLIGRWTEDDRIVWDLSARVKADPKRTTRGVLEPTVIEADDGRILMVMRGSNDRKPDLPGYRWYAVSHDGGRTFGEPRPWTYTDGKAFFSPSSCSHLIRHSGGGIYWIGNISPTNSRGNRPRYPLVIGEVDPVTLLLRKETVVTIDTRREGDADYLALSNFFVQEDRVTREILVYVSPIGKHRSTGTSPASLPGRRSVDFTGDTYIYRISVGRGKR